MTAPLRAPFPWFGGKSRVAGIVWDRLGRDMPAYIEPFFGSGAVLLGRPGWAPEKPWTETVNDRDGFVCNAWRAIRAAPEETAERADWPVNEADLHARHAWLVERRSALSGRLMGDPEWFDAKIAGWWLWGVACWIGSGFCSGAGSWSRANVGTEESPDWQLIHLGDAGRGVQRQRIHLGDAGRGVQRQRIHLGDAGRGVQRQRIHLGDAGRGVQRKLIHLGDAGQGESGLTQWFAALSARLARVRVCCGDWSRVVGSDSAMFSHIQRAAVFFDPPYSDTAERDIGLYTEDSGSVAGLVREWCVDNGARPDLRIALCGYRGEGHEVLEERGWTRTDWEAGGGYGNQGNGAGAENRKREAIWFSPGCRAASSLGRVAGTGRPRP